MGDALTEHQALAELKAIASQNQRYKSYIGMGYTPVLTPPVILRNMLENPGWYTAYTPYQPEVSQGRLEALLNFQQVTLDLTGLDIASASLLDEATAAAEAMAMAKRVSKLKNANRFFVADDVHPQTLDVVRTRAETFGFDVIVDKAEKVLDHQDVFGVLLQQVGTTGEVHDYSDADCRAEKPQSCRQRGGRFYGAGAVARHRANRARILSLVPRSALACRWATAARTRHSSPPVMNTNAPCQAALSACRAMPRVIPRCVWRCRPASSISAVKKRTPISVPRRYCWPILPACMRCSTAR